MLPHQLWNEAFGGYRASLGGSAGWNDRMLAARNSPTKKVAMDPTFWMALDLWAALVVYTRSS